MSLTSFTAEGQEMHARLVRIHRHPPFRLATLFLITVLFLMAAALSARSSAPIESWLQ